MSAGVGERLALPEDPLGQASLLLWALVAAVGGLMAWRLRQALGGGRPLLHYWYYGPLFAILAWIVGTGGIPDYWRGPFGYLARAALWIGLCFLVGESLNWSLRMGLRALRRLRRDRPRGR